AEPGPSGPDLALSFQADRAVPDPAVGLPAPRRHAPRLQLGIPASLFMEPSETLPSSTGAKLEAAALPGFAAAAMPAAVPARPVVRGTPAWRRCALPVAPAWGPGVAIVLDDFGVDRVNAMRALALPGPLTVSIMPYARQPQALAEAARRAGHEVMLHMPME